MLGYIKCTRTQFTGRRFFSLLRDKNFIGGKWVAASSGKSFEVTNPVNDKVILTPTSSALALAALVEKAGFPAGTFNVVTSSRSQAGPIGQVFCSSPKVAGISFTGSTAVGKILYQQSSGTVKRLGLELGGNASYIIFPTADLSRAVQGVMAFKFRNPK